MTVTRVLALAMLVSSAAVLACKDDPSGPDGTGRINLRIVPLEEARPVAAASRAVNKSDRVKPSETGARVMDSQPDSLADTEGAALDASARVAQQQAPRRDIVRITLSGPTEFTQDYTPAADGSVDITIGDLLEGSYSVEILGLDTDLGGELVSEFGRTTGVRVQEDQTTTATVPFGSFLPVIDPATPTTTSAFAFEVNYSSVPTATGYFVEADVDQNFTAPATLSLPGTSAIITVASLGTIYVRVRAENASVSASEAKPGDPIAIDVVSDMNPTGDGSTTAPILGVGRGANGQYDGYNIFPADDEDWFAIDLTTDATLTVDVLTSSLAPPPPDGGTLNMPAAAESPSELDPVVEIFDPSLSLVDFNDDRDGTTHEAQVSDVPVSVDGTYYIRVTSYNQESVGHYELLINVNAEPVASVTVSPTAATIQPAGTVQLTAQTFDQFGGELFGREAIWTSSNDGIATVDGAGLVTGVAVGSASITFESEGVQTAAAIDVSTAMATKVVITPNSGQLQGIGQQLQLTAQAFDGTDVPIPNKPINWWTTNTYVADAYEGAAVGEGIVEGLGNGQTIVVAEADGIEGFALVTVTDPLATPVDYWDNGPASGTSQTILGIWGASPAAIYAVGTTGTILFYNGVSWSPQTSGVGPTALYDIWGEDDYSLWAVGDGGTIIATGDQGASWDPESSPTTEPLFGVWGAAWNDIFAVGGSGAAGKIIHFDGSTWSTMTIPVTTIPFNDVWGTASDNVFAVGNNGTILRYNGASWSPMTSNTSESLLAVWGTGPGDVFAVGTNGEIVHYNGSAWVPMTSNTSQFLHAVWGTSASEVIAAGDNGTIVHYNGSTWTVLGSGTSEHLRALWGSPNPGVFATGYNGAVRLGIRGVTVEITASPPAIPPDGISTSTITVQAKDAVGTNLSSGGADVVLSSDAGSLGPVTDNNDGTYSATFTSGTTPGTVTISATVNGTAMTNTGDVLLTAVFGSAYAAGGPADFYAIDRSTGYAVFIGPIGFHRVGAIDKHPSTGVYYATAERSGDGTPVLITIDPATGAGSEVGPTGIAGSITDMSFHSNGTLYVFDGNVLAHNLHTLNLTTGAASLVGAGGFAGGGNGMEFNAANTLYIASTLGTTTTQYTLSLSNGLGTSQGTFTFTGASCPSPVINGIDRDPTDGTFYASMVCDVTVTPRVNAFGTIDMTNRVVTVITGTTVSGLDAVVSSR